MEPKEKLSKRTGTSLPEVTPDPVLMRSGRGPAASSGRRPAPPGPPRNRSAATARVSNRYGLGSGARFQRRPHHHLAVPVGRLREALEVQRCRFGWQRWDRPAGRVVPEAAGGAPGNELTAGLGIRRSTLRWSDQRQISSRSTRRRVGRRCIRLGSSHSGRWLVPTRHRLV
jgi:hypothetical protein